MDLPYNENKFYIKSWGPDSGQSEWMDFTVTIGQEDSTVGLSDRTFDTNTTISYDQVIDASNLDSDAWLHIWNANENSYVDSSGDSWIKANELDDYTFNTGSDGETNQIWVDTYLYNSGRSGWEDVKVSAEDNTNQSEIQLSGIVNEDMTFENGDEVVITEDVQLASDASLTFASGSTLDGNGNTLEIFGEVIFSGNKDSLVQVEDLGIFGKGGQLIVDYTYLDLKSLYPGLESDGKLHVKNSILKVEGEIDSTENFLIENNIISNVKFGVTESDNPKFQQNSFIGDSLIENTSWINGQTVIKNNNFWANEESYNLKLDPFFDCTHNVITEGNYWGSNDEETINEKIYDESDDLNVNGEVDITSRSSDLTDAPMEIGNYFINDDYELESTQNSESMDLQLMGLNQFPNDDEISVLSG